VRIWDVATWQTRATLKCHTDSVTALAVSPDGNWLATTGSYDQTVRIWDVATWQTRAMMRLDDSINACAWLRSNGLAIGGPAGLYLFDFLNVTPSAPSRTEG
jgi:WD40 repeat protein